MIWVGSVESQGSLKEERERQKSQRRRCDNGSRGQNEVSLALKVEDGATSQ